MRRALLLMSLCVPLLAVAQQNYPNKSLLTSEVRTALEGAGYTVTPGTTPEYFSDLQARTFRTYQRLVKEVGLTFD